VILFLLGPTATGKTALSTRLAKALSAEIISVDSALVYRGLDIGTAKPGVEERDGVVHHLIDIRDPCESYSAAEFASDAWQLITEIQSRGRTPLLVGGTMLYFNALEQGIAKLPTANTDIRNEIMAEAEVRGWAALHEDLARIDPPSAKKIHPNDPQRLQRALEVYRITGKALSELHSETKPLLTEKPVKFALVPESRAWLHERIERRLMLMREAGFLDEVRTLMQDERNHAELPSMRSVGYRQAYAHLTACAEDGIATDEKWMQKAAAATRQLAKRQFTWIRSMDSLMKLACDSLDTTAQLNKILDTVDKVNKGSSL